MEASEKVWAEADSYEQEVEAGLPLGEGTTAVRLRVDWLLEKVAEEKVRIREVEEFTARRVEMIQKHGDDEVAKLQRKVAFLEHRIRLHLPFEANGFAAEFGKKSLELPSGRVGYRRIQPTVEIEDKERAMAWAKPLGLVTVKTTETLNKTPILDWVKQTGELPPADCIEWVDAYDKFFVETGDDR